MERLQDISIRYLKGIGPKRCEAFARRGVKSVEDLFYFFPRRYEDRTKFLSIALVDEGIEQTVKGRIVSSGSRQSWKRRRFSITEASIDDNTGKLACVWFNQPYLKQYLKPGIEVILFGKVERYAGKLQMTNPEFEICSDDNDESLNIGRVVPVYPPVPGFGQRSLRKIIHQAIDRYIPRLQDVLPYDIRTRHDLLNLAQSLINIHFPQQPPVQQESYRRLAFEEFFIFQLPLALRKLRKKEQPGIAHKADPALVNGFIEGLPFELTAGQSTVV
ncbi:MAG: OB-fold nucleic acid binding domain-containing protein, partial [Candidatus Omnitrophica bacterium]|nr:OB-fold nucleic acid binding domain-containing protein [Candidatus Omnitrophota bacterium]